MGCSFFEIEARCLFARVISVMIDRKAHRNYDGCNLRKCCSLCKHKARRLFGRLLLKVEPSCIAAFGLWCGLAWGGVSGSGIWDLFLAFIIGAIAISISIGHLKLSDKNGRRELLLWSALSMGLALSAGVLRFQDQETSFIVPVWTSGAWWGSCTTWIGKKPSMPRSAIRRMPFPYSGTKDTTNRSSGPCGPTPGGCSRTTSPP